jgi:hypothetical protein
VHHPEQPPLPGIVGTVLGENAPRDVVPTKPGLPIFESTVSGICS